jgi:hypothetical protein
MNIMKPTNLCILFLLMGCAAPAQETPTEREAARDVLRNMSQLEKSIDVPTIVERLTATNAARDQVVARAKELMDRNYWAWLTILLAIRKSDSRNTNRSRS